MHTHNAAKVKSTRQCDVSQREETDDRGQGLYSTLAVGRVEREEGAGLERCTCEDGCDVK